MNPLYMGAVAASISKGGGSTSDDPYWGYVSLLLRMDGTPGDTTFTDVSPLGGAVTANGDAQVSDTQAKFDQSLALDGVSDSLYAGEVPLIGAGDFTLESWIYPTSLSGTREIAGINSGASYNFIFEIQSDGSLRTQVRSGTSVIHAECNSSASVVQTGAWQHAAVTAEGENLRVFLDGSVVASGTLSGTRSNSIAGVQIGELRSERFFAGYVDEFRITKGVARYTQAFTPPTQRFPGAE